MSNTNPQRPRWTFGNVIRKKPIKFAALTIVLTVFLISVLDPVLTKIVRGMGIESNALGGVFFFGILALSVILSGLLLMIVSNIRLNSMSPEAAQELFEKQSHFRWYRIYSFVIAYIVLGVSINLSFVILDAIGESSVSGWGFLITFAAPILIALLTANGLNALMIRLTGTNKELVDEFKSGAHNHEIPEKFRNYKDMYGILSCLEKAEVGSIRGAVFLYRVKKGIATVAKRLGKAALIVTAIGGVLAMGISWKLDKEIQAQTDARIQQRNEEDRQKKLVRDVTNKIKPDIAREAERQAQIAASKFRK